MGTLAGVALAELDGAEAFVKVKDLRHRLEDEALVTGKLVRIKLLLDGMVLSDEVSLPNVISSPRDSNSSVVLQAVMEPLNASQLCCLLEDERPDVRREAGFAILKLGAMVNESTRQQAVSTLVANGASSISCCVKLLSEPLWMPRQSAAEVFEKLCGVQVESGAQTELLESLNDANSTVCRAAAQVIRNLDSKGTR